MLNECWNLSRGAVQVEFQSSISGKAQDDGRPMVFGTCPKILFHPIKVRRGPHPRPTPSSIFEWCANGHHSHHGQPLRTDANGRRNAWGCRHPGKRSSCSRFGAVPLDPGWDSLHSKNTGRICFKLHKNLNNKNIPTKRSSTRGMRDGGWFRESKTMAKMRRDAVPTVKCWKE